jgi:AAA15 family ATPase/GTPase
MITSLAIDNFRGIKASKLNDTRLINFIAGDNGSGKTSVLEAIFFLFDRQNPNIPVRLLELRGGVFDVEMIKELFYQSDTNKRIRIVTEGPGDLFVLDFGPAELKDTTGFGQLTAEENLNIAPAAATNLSLSLTVSGKNGILDRTDYIVSNTLLASIKKREMQPARQAFILNPRNSNNPSENAQYFSRIKKANLDNSLLNILRDFQSDIEDIALITIGGQPVVHFKTSRGWSSIYLFGDGIQMFFAMAVRALSSSNSVILIDEFDTSIYYKKIDLLWRSIAKLAKLNSVQIFCSSHSRESIIEGCRSVVKELNNESCAFFRLFRKELSSSVLRLSSDEVLATEDFNLELR